MSCYSHKEHNDVETFLQWKILDIMRISLCVVAIQFYRVAQVDQ